MISDKLKLEIFIISIWQLIALIALLIAFVVLYMKANRTASLNAFFMVQLSIAIWLFGKMLKTVSPTVDMRWSFVVMYYFGICLLEVTFLEFGYAYYKGKLFTLKNSLLLSVLPLIQFIVIATNPYHHFFYKTFNFTRDSFGCFFYIHVLIEYVYILIGMILCGKRLKYHLKNEKQSYSFLVGFAVITPIVINLLYISRFLGDFFDVIGLKIIFDVTPIIFTWSLLIFVYATFKYEFFDLSPIMKHEIIYKLSTPLCVIDSDGSILLENECMEKEINNKQQKGVLYDLIESHKKSIMFGKNNFAQRFEIDNKKYNVYSKSFCSIDGRKHIIAFNDVSDILTTHEKLLQSKDNLEKKNDELTHKIKILKESSKLSAENFVARELHDIIGHSLVVAIKLLEVARISYTNGEMDINSILDKAKNSVKTGIVDIKKSNETINENEYYFVGKLKSDIESILDQFSETNIEIKFYLKNSTDTIRKDVYRTIKKIVLEAMTNTIKHANATKFLISFVISKQKINISFMDNGNGCDEIVSGNGLNGMKSRVVTLGGQMKCFSSRGEGFNIIISI